MAISGVNPKCYILALFVRDDGKRFLLGDDPYEFKDKQLHFQQNAIANDVVEVQGNDGYLLAGQVRRPGSQTFDGYVCNGTNSKEEVETKRRAFLQFFRRSHFYKVIYVFPNGTAIQRKQGFLVDDPTVQELYQQYPEYHVALNFEDVNYYTYEEDDQGQEIYAKEAIIKLAGGGATGGLIWDSYGVVWEDPWSLPLSISGVQFQILNNAGVRAPIENVELYGDTYQQTYSGIQLCQNTEFETLDGWTATALWSAGGNSTLNLNIPASTNTFQRIYRQLPTIASHKYYVSGIVTQPNGSSTSQFFLSNSPTANYPQPQINITGGVLTNKKCSGILQPTADNASIGVMIQSYNKTVSVIAMIKDFFCVDLTAKYGAGNEPTKEWCDSNLPYEPYVGGIPSPNPDYPQEVQTVTGEQTVTVTGKNLCKSLASTKTQNGVTMTKNADGTYTATGTPTGVAFILPQTQQQSDIFPAGTYTFSLSSSQVYRYVVEWYSPSDLSTRIGIFDSQYSSDAHAPHTLTTTEPFCFRISLVFVNGAGQAINYTCGFQIETGSATAYEPYQGQSYTIDLRGINLLDLNSFALGGMTNGVPSPTAKYRINNADKPVMVEPNTAYTISAQLVSPVQGFRIGIHECRADGTFISDSGWHQLAGSAYTFTTSSNTGMVKIIGSLSTTSVNVTTGSTENTTACTTVAEFMRGCTLMLEEGSFATTYQPYNPIELCKIGDYQDYIYKSGDNWFVHKETNSLTVVSSMGGLGKSGTSANNAFYLTSQFGDIDRSGMGQGASSTTVTPSYSKYFTIKSANEVFNRDTIGMAFDIYTGTLTDFIVGFGLSSSVNTLALFKTWLDNNELKVYYPLATPTDTQITDATLVGQLEALGAMKLFIGENNVLVSATNPNLPATLAFDYYTRFATLGAEWEEGGTKGATIVDVDAIDNTYPVWELMGPATNPTISVLTTNTTLTYNGTITASQKLVIDMFNKTATLNGTSVIGNVSGDFVYMAPGTNRVAYTADNTDAPDSTIYWQEVVG